MAMNIVGCIGKLMGTGLEELPGTTFARVQILPSGKKIPQNVRALTIAC